MRGPGCLEACAGLLVDRARAQLVLMLVLACSRESQVHRLQDCLFPALVLVCWWVRLGLQLEQACWWLRQEILGLVPAGGGRSWIPGSLVYRVQGVPGLGPAHWCVGPGPWPPVGQSHVQGKVWTQGS